MSSGTATVAEAHREARKEARRLALKIFRRRRTILKAVDRFHKEFGLRAYVHLEKHSRYGSFEAYSSGDELHAAIVSRSSTRLRIPANDIRPNYTPFLICTRRPISRCYGRSREGKGSLCELSLYIGSRTLCESHNDAEFWPCHRILCPP